MNRSKVILLFLLVLPIIGYSQKESKEKKYEQEFDLEMEAEFRYFLDNAAFPGQEDFYPALAIRPEYSLSWKDGYESINFKGFFRWDRDDERTHYDIRELYYQKAKNNWEVNLGVRKIYWGVIESNHLVDIINQTDQVESFDGEQKLGQPMLQFSLVTNRLGTFDFFYLPYHRRRTFAGQAGRLRFGEVIDKGDISYESAAAEWNKDFAFRWSHYFGIFDMAISEFYGTGREPLFTFDLETGAINAFYPTISQTGLELQATSGPVLWKLESIYRYADIQDFFALAAGFEYTFSNIDGKGLDIGLLGEYLYDERDELALTGLQNDLFIASRVAFNDEKDTSILFGGIFDLENSSKLLSIEASRRFGSSTIVNLEARLFSNIDAQELILSNFQQDSFLKLAIGQYF